MSAGTVYTAVVAWQRGASTVDDVTALALQEAGGDHDAARLLLQSAVKTWTAVKESAAAPYNDRNGVPIERPRRPRSAA